MRPPLGAKRRLLGGRIGLRKNPSTGSWTPRTCLASKAGGNPFVPSLPRRTPCLPPPESPIIIRGPSRDIRLTGRESEQS